MSVNFDLLISVRYQSDPCFIRRYFSSVVHCAGNVRGWVSVDCLCSVAKESARVMRKQGREGRGHAGDKKSYAGVCAKLFWRAIYCAKPRPDPGSQSGSWSHRGLGRRSPRIMWQYNLLTAIAIRLLIQPCTCGMGSSRFSAMN